MKKKITRVVVVIFIIALLSIIVYLFSPMLKMLYTSEGRLEFREHIQSLGLKGTLLIFALEFAKMLFVVIPGEPIEIFYGMCFGSINGALYLLIISFISSYVIYTLVKKYEDEILLFFFSEERITKIKESKLMNNPSKVEDILIILFLIPATPKDFLIYIGALLPIPKWKFIMIATLYRFPSFISSTIAGNSITENNWVFVVVPYIVLIVATFIIRIVHKKINKDSQLDNIIDDIK